MERWGAPRYAPALHLHLALRPRRSTILPTVHTSQAAVCFLLTKGFYLPRPGSSGLHGPAQTNTTFPGAGRRARVTGSRLGFAQAHSDKELQSAGEQYAGGGYCTHQRKGEGMGEDTEQDSCCRRVRHTLLHLGVCGMRELSD